MKSTEFDINELGGATAGEAVTGEINFSAYGDEASQSAWPAGWYEATITDGYATRKGYQFYTEDIPAKSGNGRNIRICFEVVNTPGQKKNIQEQFHYQPDLLLTRDGIAALELARAEFGGKGGSWPGEAKAMQSSSITLGRIGQLQRATGAKLVAAGGQFGLGLLSGIRLQVRLGIDQKGYNCIKEFKARK